MSIKSEIERIKVNIAAAYTALSEKGGIVPAFRTSANLASAINSIPLGTDTSDATAAAGDILSGKTAYVKGAKVIGSMKEAPAYINSNTPEVTIAGYYDPALNVISAGFLPAKENYGVLKERGVVISAASGITQQAAQTITPGAVDKTIAAGKYLTGVQTIKGDANLKAENIRKGVSIFGVSGTYEGAAGLVPATLRIGTPNSLVGIAMYAPAPSGNIDITYYSREQQKTISLTTQLFDSNTLYQYETVVGALCSISYAGDVVSSSGVTPIGESGWYKNFIITAPNPVIAFSV